MMRFWNENDVFRTKKITYFVPKLRNWYEIRQNSSFQPFLELFVRSKERLEITQKMEPKFCASNTRAILTWLWHNSRRSLKTRSKSTICREFLSITASRAFLQTKLASSSASPANTEQHRFKP